MKEELLLDEQKIKKMKKRITKELTNLGLEMKQSEVAQIIARSLGFKNEHALQKALSLNNNSISNIEKDYLQDINSNYYIDSYNDGNKKMIFITFNSKNKRLKDFNDSYYLNLIDHLFKSYIKSETGNVLICGTAGSGKTLMTKKLVERSKKTLDKLVSLGDVKELEITDNLREEELRSTIDFDILKKYESERIIFSIHERSVNLESKINRLKSLAQHCNKEINIDNIRIIIQLDWK